MAAEFQTQMAFLIKIQPTGSKPAEITLAAAVESIFATVAGAARSDRAPASGQREAAWPHQQARSGACWFVFEGRPC